jgi:hypothetical protein
LLLTASFLFVQFVPFVVELHSDPNDFTYEVNDFTSEVEGKRPHAKARRKEEDASTSAFMHRSATALGTDGGVGRETGRGTRYPRLITLRLFHAGTH